MQALSNSASRSSGLQHRSVRRFQQRAQRFGVQQSQTAPDYRPRKVRRPIDERRSSNGTSSVNHGWRMASTISGRPSVDLVLSDPAEKVGQITGQISRISIDVTPLFTILATIKVVSPLLHFGHLRAIASGFFHCSCDGRRSNNSQGQVFPGSEELAFASNARGVDLGRSAAA